MEKYAERVAAEAERLTRSVATAIGIAWSSDNRAAWERSLDQHAEAPADRVRNYSHMLGYLSSTFPGSVRIVKREN